MSSRVFGCSTFREEACPYRQVARPRHRSLVLSADFTEKKPADKTRLGWRRTPWDSLLAPGRRAARRALRVLSDSDKEESVDAAGSTRVACWGCGVVLTLDPKVCVRAHTCRAGRPPLAGSIIHF